MDLADAQIAVLAENQYQELELWYPLLRLREEGANVVVVGPAPSRPMPASSAIRSKPDLAIADVDAADFDAVVIPGGFAPEGMRRHKPMIDFVRNVHDQGALVAAICHAGWMLASAGIAKDRNVTCVALIKDDVIHAGGKYVDQAVVRDKNIITSRLPSDLPVFCKEIVNYLQESPRIRNSGKVLKPSNGRAPASPAYTHVAEFTMGPRGVASADYTGTVKMGERVI